MLCSKLTLQRFEAQDAVACSGKCPRAILVMMQQRTVVAFIEAGYHTNICGGRGRVQESKLKLGSTLNLIRATVEFLIKNISNQLSRFEIPHVSEVLEFSRYSSTASEADQLYRAGDV